MKRLAIALASAAFVSPALAADIIYDQPPAAPMAMDVMPVSPTNWTGLYVGAQAGGAFAHNDGDLRFGTAVGNVDNSDIGAGFTAGAHVGYDHQFGNNVVLGAVADLNWIDGDNTRGYTVGGSSFGVQEDLDYYGTLRARLGYAMDNILVYGSGGLAYAGYDRDSSFPGSATVGGTTYSNFRADNDDADLGYAVGGGIDVMATDNISFGVEYLYTNYGKSDYSVSADATTGLVTDRVNFSGTTNDDTSFHTIFAKVSYRFQ